MVGSQRIGWLRQARRTRMSESKSMRLPMLAESIKARVGQWVHTKAAHGIADLQRQGVDPHPHVGQVARVKAALGHAVVVFRVAADHRIRVGAGGVEEGTDFPQVVLAVGVHLQGVGETQACGFAKAGHDGGAFALVGGQGQQ